MLRLNRGWIGSCRFCRSADGAVHPERDHDARSAVRRSSMIALIRAGAGTPWTSISMSDCPDVETATVPTPKIRWRRFCLTLTLRMSAISTSLVSLLNSP